MIALAYLVAHLLAGPLAAVWTFRTLRHAGYTDGCALYGISFCAFLLWPIALLLLTVNAAVEAIDEHLGGP